MAYKKGSQCKFMYGANNVANMGTYKLDIDIKDEDISAFGDDWSKFDIVGASWSFSTDGKYDPDDTGLSAIESAVLALTASGTVKLYVDTTKYFTGTAMVSKYSIDAKTQAFVTVSISWKGSGQLTKV